MAHIPFIEKWPSLADFADDLCVAYGTAKAMKRRGVIPSQYWETVVLSAQARGLIGVTYEALAVSVSRKIESPDYLPSGEAGAQPPATGCAPATISGEAAE